MGLLSKDTAKVHYTLPGGQSDYMNLKGSDNISQFKEALMTNQWNYAMAQEQNAWNLEQWQRENEYNSPKEQLKRLAEAGLNPLLLEQQGNLSASSPQASDASAQMPGYTSQQDMELRKMQQLLEASGQAQSSTMEALRYRNELSRLQLDTAMNEEQLKSIRQGVELSKSQQKGQDIANRSALGEYTLTYGNRDYRNEFLNSMRFQNASTKNVIARQDMENEVYRSTMNVFKRLPQKQLDKLLADLKVVGEQGKYLEFKRVIRDKYHLDPDADIFNNLLYMGLRDPESYSKIVDALGKALKSSGKSIEDVAIPRSFTESESNLRP